jgi:hypothetical protein
MIGKELELYTFIFALKMKAARLSEMLVSYHTITQCDNTEDLESSLLWKPQIRHGITHYIIYM